jgi:hypothetical protein
MKESKSEYDKRLKTVDRVKNFRRGLITHTSSLLQSCLVFFVTAAIAYLLLVLLLALLDIIELSHCPPKQTDISECTSACTTPGERIRDLVRMTPGYEPIVKHFSVPLDTTTCDDS